jgi:hypothetical protein
VNLQRVDAAEAEEAVVGCVGRFPAPFCGRVLFGGQPGYECHGGRPEDVAEVDGVARVEGDEGAGGGDVVVARQPRGRRALKRTWRDFIVVGLNV